MGAPRIAQVVLAAGALALGACGGPPPPIDPATGDLLPPRTAILGDAEVARFAFGSCALQWVEQGFWGEVRDAGPAFFLFLGDAIYGDVDEEFVPYDVTEESLRAEWARLDAQPGFAALRAAAPLLATWDNHDYGHYEQCADFAGREFAQRAFLDWLGEPESSARRAGAGVHAAYLLGPPGRRVHLILLDTRSFQSVGTKDPRSQEEKAAAGLSGSLGKWLPDPAPDKTVLGAEQWAWLEAQLALQADLRIVASSTQVIPDAKHMDEWGKVPHERRRLLELLLADSAAETVLLSGNVHFSETTALRRADGEELLEFTSSGLTHVNAAYAAAPNPRRVGEPLAATSFGLVEIDWSGAPPGLRFTPVPVAPPARD